MERFWICGGKKLCGEVQVHGAKNAILPLLAAALLTDEQVFFEDVPDLCDIRAMMEILRHLGCRAKRQDGGILVESVGMDGCDMPEWQCKQIRSSIFLLGPLLAKLRCAKVPCPGGCEIGLRPIDLHLKGLRMLGVHIQDVEGKLVCRGENMHAGNVYLDYPSVGATENVIMASVLLPGTTVIHNAAREPEIVDLCRFINRMGGRIRGSGSQVIRIDGVKRLHGVTYKAIPDRIVAGTLLCAGAVTGGLVRVRDAQYAHLLPVIDKLCEMGCDIKKEKGGLILRAPERLCAFSGLQTSPHPGFPTDMQSQMLALASVADGCSMITENVFESRYATAGDLMRMGADIRIAGRTAVVRGVKHLTGAHVHARDLRGGAALVLAALCARGESTVSNIALIDRGYDKMEHMLASLGAQIKRISDFREEHIHADP